MKRLAALLLILAATADARLAYRQAERDESRAWLLAQLEPGDTITCVFKEFTLHEPPFRLRCYELGWDDFGEPWTADLSWHVAVLLGVEWIEAESVLVFRTYTNQGGAISRDLGRRLWPDGFEHLEVHCPSLDHRIGHTRTWHPDSERALRFDWL